MVVMCDYCGVMGAMVHCESDSAKLCLNCDTSVHSANPLSCRHPRTVICDKCNSQPANIRCMDDKISLCQGCEWNDCSGLGHSTQRLNYYTGCPSINEFSNIWPSLLEMSCDSSFTPMAGYNPINSCLVQSPNECSSSVNDLSSSIKFEDIIGTSSVVPLESNYVQQGNNEQLSFISADEGSNLPKNSSSLKEIILGEGDDICKGVDLDVALNFDCGYEMLGCTQEPTKYQCVNGGLDCLELEKPLPVMEANNHIESNLEVAPSAQQDCITFQTPLVNGSTSLLQSLSGSGSCMLVNPSCNTNIALPFPTGSLALPTITGESSIVDYQDPGLSQVFLPGESPWESSLDTSSPQARDKAKLRYIEKKKTRMFGKQIRYASRKARADTRKRVKGRFVKSGEAYDYDPLGKRIIK